MILTGWLRRHRDRAVLIVCLAVSLFLLTIPETLRFTLARALAAAALAPADGAVWLGHHLERLRGENEELRERLMALSDNLGRAEEYRKEAARLRRLLDFRAAESYRFLPAELLSYPLSFRERNLVRLDRGRRDGVRPGMPVVSPRGLIGAVHTVHPYHAEVQLLASRNFAVSCRDMRSRVLGVFKWDPRRGFHVDRVDLGEDVQVGDRFMTSGLGDRFPEGFLLGTVTELRRPPGALRLEIHLAPAVPIQTLEDVFVVTRVSEAAPGFPLPTGAPADSAEASP